MIKIALCLYGKVGNMGGKDGCGETIDPSIGCKSYLDNIITPNKHVDVFLHSWSFEYKDKLNTLYNPVSSLVEPQEKFEGPNARLLSRWSSNNKVLGLVKNSGIKYDWIVLGRYDLVWLTPLHIDKFEPAPLIVSNTNTYPHLKHGRGDVAYERNHVPGQIYDLWFIGRPTEIYKLEHLFYYLQAQGKRSCNTHKYLWSHIIEKIPNVKFMYYRGFDYELYRWLNGVYH